MYIASKHWMFEVKTHDEKVQFSIDALCMLKKGYSEPLNRRTDKTMCKQNTTCQH